MNFTIRTKLTLVNVLAIALLLVLGALGLNTSNQVVIQFSEVSDKIIPLVQALEDLKFFGLRVSTATEAAVFTLQSTPPAEMDVILEEQQQAIQLEVRQYDRAVTRYETLIDRYFQNQSAIAGGLVRAGQEMLDSGEALITLIENEGSEQEILDAQETFRDEESTFLTLISASVETEVARLRRYQTNVDEITSSGGRYTLAITIGAVALLSLVAFLLYRSITRPLNKLSAAAVGIEKGSFDVKANLNTSDEFGKVGKAFDSMVETLLKRETELVELNQTLEQRVRDRTAELRVAIQQAEESSRLKSEFLSTMSHELRTPLNAIIGYAGIMQEGIGGDLDDAAQDMVGSIYSSGTHLLGLINQILDLSKIEAGRFQLVEEEIVVSDLVERLQHQLQVLADQKEIAFEVKIAPDIPAVIGDSERIAQIITNLLSNAFKFTEHGGVYLHLGWHDEQLMIRVRDTGIGIPPHALQYIFDEFRQVDGTSQRTYGGTGLGLAIVQKLARVMGGDVKVESALSVGSTFTVTLPLKPVLPEMMSA